MNNVGQIIIFSKNSFFLREDLSFISFISLLSIELSINNNPSIWNSRYPLIYQDKIL